MNIYIQRLQSVAIANKYTEWYCAIVQNAITRSNLSGYFERHHILPRCFKLGGEKDSSNIVALTAREHFICHRLLVMFMAYGNGNPEKYVPASLTVERIRQELSQVKTGSTGKKWTPEQRAKLKSRKPHNLGLPMSLEAKEHLRQKRALQKMSPRSEATKSKLSQKLMGLTKGTKCWNNGVITKRQIDCPGPDWVPGILRASVVGKVWWNNGVRNCKAHHSPGPEWEPGRFKSQTR